MAGQSTKGSSARKKNTSNTNTRTRRQDPPMDLAIRNEILLIVLAALAIILFLCNFGVVGKVGDAVSGVMFGLFGLLAYVAPLLIFLMIAFAVSNIGNSIATRKLVAGVVFLLLLGMIFEFFSTNPALSDGYQIGEIYTRCREGHKGGGVLSGSLAYLSCKLLGTVGTVILILVLGIICLVIVTEKSFLGGVAAGGRKVYERSREDAAYRRERAEKRREALSERRAREAEERRQREEELENEKLLRMDKKVSGVMMDTALSREPEKESPEKIRDDIHEITIAYDEDEAQEPETEGRHNPGSYHYIEQDSDDLSEIHMEEELPWEKAMVEAAPKKPMDSYQTQMGNQMAGTPTRERPAARPRPQKTAGSGVRAGRSVEYRFPPIDLLDKPKTKKEVDPDRELRETAKLLEQILGNFGVKVTVTQYSRGPSVTRYEMQPEQGVKVSKIVGLTDDIKLNLAATDIRIEAPIPGKAAVGIEVPNKENSAVPFRDLVESSEFTRFPANLLFAVGKDISGKIVLADIAKMPHLLIAGATGSGKSVCINTIIMGILYKAHPEDVKMIMIDPKVVELSVYNGIPHLLIPVVTDPKKAAAALHWGVAEMTERYKKFADLNVRDLKGYNKKVENMKASGDADAPKKLPQILIIVDELADLMMVSPGEVEESICRLAQLARACGIHLIIATQRPSVDVITGLIKANMPSRVAFAVSSGVDSRTILDMVGAEKLLGKGDMLFYPQGYPKPSRIQGPFVSDDEVSRVVEFLKDTAPQDGSSEEVEEQINNIAVETGTAGGVSLEGDSEYDEYFEEAGRFIIEKDKASIGMLQRMFKIGFNRAARIMDQLADAGVVGEEEGTKPRRILMSAEEFEAYVKNI